MGLNSHISHELVVDYYCGRATISSEMLKNNRLTAGNGF